MISKAKKVIFVICLLFIILGLSACFNDEEEENKPRVVLRTEDHGRFTRIYIGYE